MMIIFVKLHFYFYDALDMCVLCTAFPQTLCFQAPQHKLEFHLPGVICMFPGRDVCLNR